MSDRYLDPRDPKNQRVITDYINRRLGECVGSSDQHKDVAREVSDRYGILLTPREVKDINTSGW